MRLQIHEHEPAEAFALLATDDIDLALTYDYNLAPAPARGTVKAIPLWTTAWGLAVRASVGRGDRRRAGRLRPLSGTGPGSSTPATPPTRWPCGSSRRWPASSPRVAHRVDSLDLVQELIVAGLGVGLLSEDEPLRAGVRLVPLRDPPVTLRAYAVVRAGREAWPPLRLVLERLAAQLS